MIALCEQTQEERILVLEDDIDFLDDPNKHFFRSMASLPNDFDLFYMTKDRDYPVILKQMLDIKYPKGKWSFNSQSKEYYENSALIIEGALGTEKIQIIPTKMEYLEGNLNDFDIGICRVYLDRRGNFAGGEQALKSLSKGVLEVYKDQIHNFESTYNRINKYIGRFPGLKPKIIGGVD